MVSFRNEEDFLQYINNDTNLQRLLAGVVFKGDFRGGSFPDDVNVTLRFHSDPVNVPPGDESAFTGM